MKNQILKKDSYGKYYKINLGNYIMKLIQINSDLDNKSKQDKIVRASSILASGTNTNLENPTLTEITEDYSDFFLLTKPAKTTLDKWNKVKTKYLINTDLYISELTPKLVFDVFIKPLLLEGKYSIADYLKGKLIAIFDYAIISYPDLNIRDLRPINRLMIKPKEERHYPSLEHSQIAYIASLLTRSTKQSLLYQLTLYTLLRPSEVVSIELGHIQEKYILIPRTKTNKNFKVPLTTHLKEVIKKLVDLKVTNNPYLLEGRVSGHLNSSTLNVALKRAGLKNVQTAHSIRAIGRTWLEAQGIRYEVAEACLNHSVGNSTFRAYVRTDYFNERMEAMEQWGEYIYSQLKLYTS